MAQKSKNNNKMNMNMPRPSMLWIYGLIGLFIIGWYLFDGSNEAPLPSDWTTVQEMVEKGDVEKIQVVNRDQAQVFLKKEAGEKYRNDSGGQAFPPPARVGRAADFHHRFGRFVSRGFEGRRGEVGADRSGDL